MKGCGRSCLLWLAGWAVASGAFWYYLRQSGERIPELYWASAGAGLCAVILYGYILGIVRLSKERKMLLDAIVGKPPEDGEWVAVSGVIRSMQPLRTPLTNVHAVTYTYDIYRMERSGKSSTKVSYWEGKALTPSTIATKQGAVRLLAVPQLDVPLEDLTGEQAFANAERYIHETNFQTRDMPKEQRIGMEEESNDDDGSFRLDKSERPHSGVDVRSCTLHERHIKQGETVCAFGLYSAARGGIIPHPNWAHQMRIMRGEAENVAKQLSKRMRNYSIGIVVFAAIAYGVVRLYQNFALAQAAAGL